MFKDSGPVQIRTVLISGLQENLMVGTNRLIKATGEFDIKSRSIFKTRFDVRDKGHFKEAVFFLEHFRLNVFL